MTDSTDPHAPKPEAASAKETPLAYRVVRGSLWVAASSYFNIGCGFIANLALTRILAPDDFGTFALASSFFLLMNLRTKVSVGFGFAQRKETTGELVGTLFALDVMGGMATLLLAAVAIPILLALGYSSDVVWVVVSLAGIGVLDSITGTAQALLDKELHFARTSLVGSVAFATSYIPALWLAVQGGGYWSLVAQNAVYQIILLVAMWWVARRNLPHIWRLRWRFNWPTGKYLIRFGATVGIGSLAGTLLSQLDSFLIGSLVGVTVLGFYDRAYRMAQWPSLLLTSVITKTSFYTYARLQDDPARLGKTVAMTFWLISTLGLPMAASIFAAAPDILVLLWGETWLPSAVFLRFLIVYSVVLPLLGDAGALFAAVGRPRLSVVITVISAATLILTGVPLTVRYGAVGTCVAVGIAFAVALALTYRYIVQVVALRVRDTLGWPALATVAALAAYLALVRLVGMDAWPVALRVFAKFALVTLVYFGSMGILQPRALPERVGYIWRLVRGNAKP